MTTTSYTQLKDGTWGVRIIGTVPQVGAIIVVTKKSGETKTENIAKVLWTGNGVTLATIRQHSHQKGVRSLPSCGCSCHRSRPTSTAQLCSTCQLDECWN